jgi:hypothetical protein
MASGDLTGPACFGALVGASAQAAPLDAPERRYALREVKARLHQASFRDAVLAPTGTVCDPSSARAAARCPNIVMDALGEPIADQPRRPRTTSACRAKPAPRDKLIRRRAPHDPPRSTFYNEIGALGPLPIRRFASHLGGLASPGAEFGRYQRAKHRQDGTIRSQSPHT